MEGTLWAVVLAGGQGTRLASLTRRLYGYDLPKQFATLVGGRSLLQAALDRIAPAVSPERTLVVVPAEHEAVARAQLALHPVEVVVQPRNLDTGPGLLLPLARLLRRDPGATVAVFPSDHHVERPGPLLEAVRECAEAAGAGRFRLALLGVVPDRPEIEYGWILPGERIGGVGADLRRVKAFREKPRAALAERLLRLGGLWNTFILVGRLADYWALARRHLRRQVQLFELYAHFLGRGEDDLLASLYQRMRPANFSRAVLQPASGIAVRAVAGAGWSDWGSPGRILETLRPPVAADLVRAVAEAVPRSA